VWDSDGVPDPISHRGRLKDFPLSWGVESYVVPLEEK